MSTQDDDVPLDQTMNARPDELQAVSPLIRRIVADNGGPYTFTGTCTYVVGHGSVAVIDPGPDDPRHRDALLTGLSGETIAHILVTHTHRDHAPGAATLAAATGAEIVGCASYRPASLNFGDMDAGDKAHDVAYRPDRVLQDGHRVAGVGYDLFAVATPGHAANHLAFALPQEEALFSGDHVMAWSTTVVAPPDGSMRAYMASLDKLRARADAVYWPGHGGPVLNPQRFVRGLIHHRRHRETAILQRLKAGDHRIETLVERLYAGLAPALKGAAAMSVLAHLQDMAERGLVMATGAPPLKASYVPV
ncbi:MBL fold metallo-hydrolase [Lichenihabitans psoromatis]|uniref:MBL fold metallo-hydrolase n=1 Tax=Lichenihabitans psoromatis TaxID=2528642 RepID=UPI003CCB376A